MNLRISATAAFSVALGALMLTACPVDPVDPVDPGEPDATVNPAEDTTPADPGSTSDSGAQDTRVDSDKGGPEDLPEPQDLPEPECTPDTDWKCNDGEACTDDACVGGQCINAVIDGCCSDDAQCDDGVPCTEDTCNKVQNSCLHVFETNNCCLDATDCDDGDACTEDLCLGWGCVRPNRCECIGGVQCDDGSPCTDDSCVAGACQYAALGAAGGDGCCATPAQCGDGDLCQMGVCYDAPDSCSDDADCSGPNACAQGTCAEGTCTFDPQCCLSDAQCDDGHAATRDRCVANRCVYDWGQDVACEGGACATDGPCVGATCVTEAGLCSFWPTNDPTAGGEPDTTCCVADGGCDAPAGDPCAVSTCQQFQCQPAQGAPSVAVWTANFDGMGALGPIEGWTLTDNGNGATWHVSTSQAISVPASLRFADPSKNSYDVGHATGVAESPAIDPLAFGDGVSGLQVHFWRNADVEPFTTSDLLWLDLVQGPVTTKLWDKTDDGGPGSGWKLEVLDLNLPQSGQPFSLRWTFDSVDGVNNATEGVYVDDVQIHRICE